MRLDKLLTAAGLTRAQAKRAVAEGRARVNGEAVRDAGMRVDGAEVLLDGKPVTEPGEVYWMLHKPAGVLTAVRDAREKTAFALLPEDVRRREPSPIGRLDKDVTGLLLFTTHGELLHRLISPRYAVEKVYIARVEGTPDASDAETLAAGVAFSDFTARPARLEVLKEGLVRLTVTEGRYHEVKRLLAAVGHPVLSLAREAMGGVSLDAALDAGEGRPLTGDEIARLFRAAQLDAEQKDHA